jgi:transaldolase
MYVEELIGPDTVDTMPPATIKDFLDHGKVRDSLLEDVDGARKSMKALADAGIDMTEVTRRIQDDGVASFAKSFQDLLETITKKRQEMLARAG